MIYIRIQTETTAEKVEKLVAMHGSYLRFDGAADSNTTLSGFMIFEDE